MKKNRNTATQAMTRRSAGLLLILSIMMGGAADAMDEPPQVHFTVNQYKVTGDNPLSDSETQAILNRFVGDHYGLDGLQAAADELEASFRDRGFAFYRVTLVPQELKDGVIEFQVTEFSIDKITIDGNEHFSDENIMNSAPGLVSGKTPNTAYLSRAINMANEQASKNVKLTFKESQSGAGIDAALKVEDQSPDFFFLNLNNTGTEETGEYRLTAAYNWSNLFQKDHNLTITYTFSPDEFDVVTQIGAFYSIPDYASGSKYSIFFADSDVETGIINNNFPISGRGTVLGFNYNKRLLQVGAYKQAFDVGIIHKAFENSNQFTTTPTEIVSRPLRLAYTGAYLTTTYSVGFNVEYNMNISGGSKNEDADYLAANCSSGIVGPGCTGSADWALMKYGFNYQYFYGKWITRFLLSGQQTSDQLISGEQYGVGGMRSVRGYEERSILGDSGMQMNLEVWMPAYTEYEIRPVVFYDMASITREYDQGGLLATDEDLASIGGGMRWSHGDNLNLSLDLGYVTKAAGDVEKGDTRLHLDMFYRF